MENLQSYIQDTQSLLRDTNGLLTPVSQLTRWINQARYNTALETSCIEILVAGNCPAGTCAVPGQAIVGAAQPGNNLVQAFQTIANVEKYPYSYATPFIQANNQGVKAAIDVKQVAVSWGSFRPEMTWMPFRDIQAYYRAYNQGVFNFPIVWGTTGDGLRGEVWLWPPPSVGGVSQLQGSQGEFEWLCSCVPMPIYSAEDYEALPEPFQNAIKYKAAAYCLLGAQRFGAAQIYHDMWSDQLGLDRVAISRGQPGNAYWGVWE